MSTIYTVKELTANVKRSLEGQYPFVWVKGEVSNLSRPSSGHVYFSLKDSEALLQCVWFKTYQKREENFDPLTGEVFEDGPRPSLAQKLTNGQQVLCAGHVSVYAQRGSYQLVVALMQDGGHGALHAAFEAIKDTLRTQGYFSQERKRQLPYNPQKVAVVTASHGAAIQDFLRIAQTCGTGSHIRIYPVLVQGHGAALSIAKAIKQINEEHFADVIVLIRGGGSLEDLWAFNEEEVAHAVFHSTTPILAGIGHEVDVSIADMTADVRAATPTHAAQLLWPTREDLLQQVDGLEISLQNALQRIIYTNAQRLLMQEQAMQWLSPLQLWQRHMQRLQHTCQMLTQLNAQNVESLHMKLERCSAFMATALSGKHHKLTAQLETIDWRLQHSALQNVHNKEMHYMPCAQILSAKMHSYLERQEHVLEQLCTRLVACDPKAPLAKGYVLMENAKGQVVQSISSVRKGDILRMHVADGLISAQVSDVEKHT